MVQLSKTKFRVAFLFLAVTTLVACAPKSKNLGDYAVRANTTGLERDYSESPSKVYIRSGAPTLAAYDRFIVEPVFIRYSDPKMKSLSKRDLERMRLYFRKAVIKEIRDAGYEVGESARRDTLRISLTITGLKIPENGGTLNVGTMAAGVVTGIPLAFSIAVGEVTIEGVFRESLTNRIDAVVADRARGSRALNPKPWSTWADVEDSFDKWAEGIREGIDRAHGKVSD